MESHCSDVLSTGSLSQRSRSSSSSISVFSNVDNSFPGNQESFKSPGSRSYVDIEEARSSYSSSSSMYGSSSRFFLTFSESSVYNIGFPLLYVLLGVYITIKNNKSIINHVAQHKHL